MRPRRRRRARWRVAILGRLRASERLREHVAALTRHHLRLGFLVHEMPLGRRDDLRLPATPAPRSQVDVTVLSVADRLATRGDELRARRSPRTSSSPGEMIARGARLARATRRGRRSAATSWPRRSGSTRGRSSGELLAELEEASFAARSRTASRRSSERGELTRPEPRGRPERRLPRVSAIPTASSARSSPASCPAQIVDEDERTVAFMDINPATRGHALVIPRRHAANLLEIEPEDLGGDDRAPPSGSPRRAHRAPRRRRRQPAQLVRRRGLADRLPLPRPRDPALRRTIRCGCRGRRRRATPTRSRRAAQPRLR